MQADIPAQFQQERTECSVLAANHYRIPPLVLLAVAELEGGKPGQKVRNSNGTYDYGTMQINTVSLMDLRKYGINEHHVLAKGCYPYLLAAWRLAGHLQNDEGDIWQRAANYHSRTPYYNSVYRANLMRRAAKIEIRLKINKPAAPLTYKATNGANQAFKWLKPEQRPQQLSAYTAPIRVKGFGNLNAYPLQSKQTGSFGDTTAIRGW